MRSRLPNFLWMLQFYTPDNQTFKLKSIDFEGKIADIYEEIDFQ